MSVFTHDELDELARGSIADRNQAARKMAAVLRGNLQVLLSELDEILAAGTYVYHLSPSYLEQMRYSEQALAVAVERCARSAGLVAAE